MTAYVATFKRVEQKYCLQHQQYQAVMDALRQHLQPDAFPRTVVSSLYWDTPANEIISRSLEKPLYKEKLRVRRYCSVGDDGMLAPSSDCLFVELKKKYDGVVYKRRLSMSAAGAKAWLDGVDFQRACALFPLAGKKHAEPTGHELQVAREIEAFLGRYPDARPAMITRCLRTAWKDPQPESQLRITFDAQVQGGRPAGEPFDMQLGDDALDLLPGGQVLMELKQVGGLSPWLTDVLSANKIYPQSFSKYGTAFELEEQEYKCLMQCLRAC